MQRLRVRRRHAFVPVVFAYRAAVGACEKGQQRLLASHLLRAMQCHASVPDDLFLQCCRQRGQKGARSTSRPYIPHVRGSAIHSRGEWAPTALPSARANRASSTSGTCG